ncbi:MAG: glycosyltransferase family 4 protein [Kiritimatiellae bacterium]|nr:glycosyltransferase family 4 protein [Kiritimatiellia bacterium]
MKILHVVPGLDVIGNGIAVAAKLIAGEQKADLVEARLFSRGKGDISQYDEIWVHSAWLPMVFRSSRRVLKAGKHLVRMSHANYDPVRLAYHGLKKRLVAPIDRYYLRRADKVIATCEAEADWIRAYEPRFKSIEVTDLKRFFNLNTHSYLISHPSSFHLLYLGRRHPLKGVEYLETAVSQLNSSNPTLTTPPLLRIVSNAFGDELEKVWSWCDVLILPTLSDNFGLVTAEALERGKRVITTDGAPAWGDGNTYGGRLTYLRGYRNGTSDERVKLLKAAIGNLIG